MGTSRADVAAIACLIALIAMSGCEGTQRPGGTIKSPTVPPGSASRLTASPHASTPEELLARPLRLPSLAPGQPCPVTPKQRRPPPMSALAQEVLGDGPVVPVAGPFGEDTTLRPKDRGTDGWYARKVPWVAADYQGPVLIRAGRIDGPGGARVRFFYTGQLAGGGVLADITASTPALAGATEVQRAGCYAYQVDGSGFTEIIVFKVVPGRVE